MLPAHGKGGARATINNDSPPAVPRSGTEGGKRFRDSALAEYQNRKIFVSLIEKIFWSARFKNVKKIFLFCSPSGERKRWSGRWDLNPRPQRPERCALARLRYSPKLSNYRLIARICPAIMKAPSDISC